MAEEKVLGEEVSMTNPARSSRLSTLISFAVSSPLLASTQPLPPFSWHLRRRRGMVTLGELSW